VPDIVTVVDVATGVVVTLNVPVEFPALMSSVAGTDADRLLDDSDIKHPPAGAGPVSVTVPVGFDPPYTVVTDSPTLKRAGGLIVSVAD
jgi:hypothetical protein